MVVMVHSSRFAMPYRDYHVVAIGTNDWYGMAFYVTLFASPTVLFVMVSGIFFLTPQRNVTARKIWSKNVPKMACAYVFWCLIYALYRIHMMDPQPEFTAKLLLTEWIVQPTHLWYIPMIIGLYILTPFFRCITKLADGKLYRYGLALFLGALLINSIITMPELPYGSYLKTIVGYTPVSLLCQYSCWMILGYALYTYRPSKKARKMLYVAGIAAVLVAYVVLILQYYTIGYNGSGELSQKFTIPTFFKAVAIFLLMTNVLANVKLSERATKILVKVSNCTLMIYLVHWLFLQIIYDNKLILCWGIDPVIGVWIIAFVTYAAGALVGVIFQAVPWKKMRNAVLDQFFPDRTVLVTRKK